ncbi:dihydrofolate reductase [Flexithrix dorotheae]|uniref:dihydrofolate reductase n=1 Tax=Flexithrix dorotheae TaxID=70993 RepID=UPI000370F401|nr:dihydrofolate reductase [Flexithrix dorotheae]
MIISMIAAVSENNIIGQDNKLAWNLPTDTAYYKNTIQDKTIIMGRKTAESPDMFFSKKRNILITRKGNYQKENFEVTSGLEEALKLPEENEEVFITGGGEIYKMGMEIADKLYITRVHTVIEGDTSFPEIKPELWKMISERKIEADEKNEYSFSFLIYERK